MADQKTKPPADPDFLDLPELHRRLVEPKGVLQKNLKIFLYLGASILVIIAAIFSAGGKKPATQAGKNQPPQPTVQDNTDNNVADLKSQLQAEQLKEQQQAAIAAANDPTLATATPAQRAAAGAYGPTGQSLSCVPGQPCPQAAYGQQNGGQQQLTPEQQQAQQLAAKERELAYNSRFASNLVYARPADPPPSQQQSTPGEPGGGTPTGYAPQQNSYAALSGQAGRSFIAPRAAGEPPAQPERAPEINLDSAVGQPYVIYEGTTLDTVLMNRLDGDAVGPVKVLVSNPLYSHDHQHVLIPDGTIVLGEAKKIGATGFGQQRRIAVVFHRMIMPDGYSVDLDQFHGLDQIGEEGLKDKVNNHYIEIFGTSIVLGVIAGAGEITQGGGAFNGSGSQEFTNGAAGSVSESATTVLDQFLQIPPTITIREGHRVKVYFTQDMLLPAYTNHTIDQTF
ncbi:MAG: TraB/TrbI/VirB10 family type IV secretion system protein [Acidobacteriaceae bacterium]